MNDSTSTAEAQSHEPEAISKFGYELIREILLPDLLGKDTPGILYWAGKQLARKYPLNDLNEVVEFFGKASWGVLVLKKETKSELDFELASPLLASRSSSKTEHFFQLEAGFLAQQLEFHKEVATEAYEHPLKKGKKVQFTVKWDKKDNL